MMGEDAARPARDDDGKARNAYWIAQGMPWRTEPEIGEERKRYLTERRTTAPDIESGIYPFRDENGPIRLDRADVEWLLATHESLGVRGPVRWEDVRQRNRYGLDLRGADLRGAFLQMLPLARMRGGLDYNERSRQEGMLYQKRELAAAHFEEADLSEAHLEHANLSRVHFEGAVLRGTNLSGADLFWARLQQATLSAALLQGVELQYAFFDTATYLRDVVFSSREDGAVSLGGVRWREADLSVVDWASLSKLGEEREARTARDRNGKRKSKADKLRDFQAAARANRQLATVLRAQGIADEADRFAYRAQVCQRVVTRKHRRYPRYVGSLLLDLLAGYGYRPGRAILLYMAVILWFANFYVWASHGLFSLDLPPTHVEPLQWYEGLILSVSSFHGRGFQPFQNLNDPIAALAGFEAIFGLVIEVSFIATFTQRFFSR